MVFDMILQYVILNYGISYHTTPYHKGKHILNINVCCCLLHFGLFYLVLGYFCAGSYHIIAYHSILYYVTCMFYVPICIASVQFIQPMYFEHVQQLSATLASESSALIPAFCGSAVSILWSALHHVGIMENPHHCRYLPYIRPMYGLCKGIY